MKTRNLILQEKFANIISSRVAVRNIFDFLNRSLEQVIVDFNDISFISSSAAHQIVIEVRALNDQNTEVIFINISDDVQRMINLAKTDRKNIFTTESVKVYNATTESDLKYLFL